MKRKRLDCLGVHVSDALPSDEDVQNYRDDQKALQDEWNKDKPKRKTLKELMKSTFQGIH